MKWWHHILIMSLIALLGIAPILSAVIAGSIAAANGCRLDEAGVYPCVIGGQDYGGLLATMGVLGWLALVSLPLAGTALLVYLVVLIVRRSKKTAPPSTTR
jgi:hypothetical protein